MNLVLIDECCGKRIGEWLKHRGLEDVLAICDYPCLRGMDDETLTIFGQDNNAFLITNDKQFYQEYQGAKAYYHQQPWYKIYKKIIKYFNK